MTDQKPMEEHPHAEVLRAIASGVPIYNFEARKKEALCQCSSQETVSWSDLVTWAGWQQGLWITSPHEWDVRRKMLTRIINGYKVPAPLSTPPAINSTYYVSSISHIAFFAELVWSGTHFDYNYLKRGLCHDSVEAAAANAKAMIGIDPNAP